MGRCELLLPLQVITKKKKRKERKEGGGDKARESVYSKRPGTQYIYIRAVQQ